MGANDGMSFQQGVMLLFLTFLASYLLIRHFFIPAKITDDENTPSTCRQQELLLLLLFFAVATVAILLTTTPMAAALWRRVSLLEVIQFPWRLLALAAFTFSALGGLVVWQLGEETGLLRAIPEQISRREEADLIEEAGILTLSLAIVFASFAYSQPSSLQPVEAWREDGRAIEKFDM